MRILFLFLILTIISTGIFAQELGYIQNDSAYISCDIYPQSEVKSGKSCLARFKNSAQIITYTPDQIHAYGYGFTDYYSFKVVSGNDSMKRFLEAIVQGDSPVYYFTDESGDHFYILNDKKELVELIKSNEEYKNQLAAYYDAPAEIIPRIHYGLNTSGVIQTVKLMKEASMEVVGDEFVSGNPKQKSLTMKQKKRMRMIRPKASFTFQTGVTSQRLPLDLHTGLPTSWDEFKVSSLTFSLAADIPIMKHWPVTYHQEICFNKFVSEYMHGSNPPDYQLIQDFSVISLPAMVRYSFGRKRLNVFINGGVQVDIALNKNNVGWLILTGNNSTGYDAATIAYLDYSTFQTGLTGGFGVSYKISNNLAINSEFRYSAIFNVLPDKSGTESQSAFKVGITYNIFEREKKQ